MTSEHSPQQISDWLHGRLPSDWFTDVQVTVDREEVTVVGTIPPPESDSEEAAAGRIARFREETRATRIEIARELESRGRRKVAWGVTCGDTTRLFTRLAVPVMTRLTQPDRRVLDTLVESGVARSRADAVAWCVRLVRQHQGEWLGELQDAMQAVRRVREQGPEPAGA